MIKVEELLQVERDNRNMTAKCSTDWILMGGEITLKGMTGTVTKLDMHCKLDNRT